ncbi:MAG: GSCFA domain-containing protein [Parasphingopyxis sp.]
MMTSPYEGAPNSAFWRTAVADRPDAIGDLYRPKFAVDKTASVATAGSCFAQHVGRALRVLGVKVIDSEPLAARFGDAVALRYGYRMYSARYGNIYTTRQLAQLLEEASGLFRPADPVWKRGDRFFDAQRPAVEPDGLDSEERVLEHRAAHLPLVLEAFSRADLVVFTFGMTEAWIHKRDGTVYPTAPGTIAGEFDPGRHAFRNYQFGEILADFERAREILKGLNPAMRFLITVSPVPITATASGNHVEVANSYTKSTLRAVCGQLYASYDDVDYLPSYEAMTSQKARGRFYQDNLRTISREGVLAAMKMFTDAQGIIADDADAAEHRTVDDALCEEELLEAFAQ